MYFSNESSFRRQKLRSKLHRINNQSVLTRRLLRPSTTDVRRPIVQHQIERPASVLAHEPLDGGPALGLGDVLLDADGAAHGADGDEVDPDDEAADGDSLDGYLHPAAGGGAEVEDAAGGAEEAELGVELDELPCRAGSVAVFFG